jgi:hypothetical protein
MVVAVLRKPLQIRRRRRRWPSVLGDGLPERLRSTSLALIGVVAAAGLASVALTLQQGFPLVASGPIPEPPPQRTHLGEGTAVSQVPPARDEAASPPPVAPDAPAAATGVSDDAAAAPFEVEASPPGGGDAVNTGIDAAGGRRAVPDRPSRRPVPERPPPPLPATAPPEEPSAVTSTDPPAPEPEAEVEVPVSEHPGRGNAYGKGNGLGNSGMPPGRADVQSSE